jgi:hypothetical protein
LAEISGDLRIHAMDFFEQSAKDLRSNKLLQHGLELVRCKLPLTQESHSKLLADLKAAQYMARNLKNDIFEKFKTELNEFAKSNQLPSENFEGYAWGLLSILENQNFAQ